MINNIMEIYDELRVSLHKYMDNEILVVFDNDGEPWFLGKHITDILEYVRSNDAINDHIKNNNIRKLEELTKEKIFKNAQPSSLYINKSGLYSLIMKSKMKVAQQFQEWISDELLPTLDKKGYYYHTSNSMKKIEKLNNTLKKYKKRTRSLERNQKHPKYKKGGHIYVKRTELKGVYKIGMAKKNIKTRINTYNSGNSDNIELIYAIPVNEPEKIELCLKYYLYKYKYRNKKENYRCTLKEIREIIIKCLGYEPDEFSKYHHGGSNGEIEDINVNINNAETIENNNNIMENDIMENGIIENGIIDNEYFEKYIKYKNKYIKLKLQQLGKKK
jgi:prophage antirepressor-like protein